MFKMSLAEKRFSFLMTLENMYVILFFNFFYISLAILLTLVFIKLCGGNYFEYIFKKEAVEIK